MGSGLKIAAMDLVKNFVFSDAVPMQYRWKILKKLDWPHLEYSMIRSKCLFIGDVRLGEENYLNRQVFIDGSATVTTGSHVQFGPRSMVITGTHEIGEAKCRGGKSTAQPVHIGNGCWIGAGAIILPGVTIGDGCVIAAGAVVAKDCEPNSLYAGVPARLVRKL